MDTTLVLTVVMMTVSSMALITGVEREAVIVMIGCKSVMIVTSGEADLHRHLLIIENKVGVTTVASTKDPDLDQAKEDSIVDKDVEMVQVVAATE